MAMPDSAKPAVRRLSLRNVLVLVALGVVVVGGFYLQQSGRLDALIAFAMKGPQQPPRELPPYFIVRVIDEQSQPVPVFEMRLGRSDMVGGAWTTSGGGQINIPGSSLGPERDAISNAIDVVVRADGFASTFAHFAGSEREKLLAGNATITMCRGEKVELRFRLPEGLDWPAKLMPEIYFAEHQGPVRTMWQPQNRRIYKDLKGHSLLDFNFLNAKEGDAGRFALQLAQGGEPFYVAIHSPGFLQFFERGPVTLADTTDGVLEIDIPKPAVLDVSFDSGNDTVGGMPFEGVSLRVLQKNPYRNSYVEVMSQDGNTRRQELRLGDLAPADYRVEVRARIKPDMRDMLPAKGHPGIYLDFKEVVLGAGETRRVDFHYKPFDAHAFRGDHSAKIRIVNPDGSPAAGRKVTVFYCHEGYGDLEVFSGKTPKSGEIEIQGLTDRKLENVALGAYRIDVDGHQLRYFSFTKGTSSETFAFQLPGQVGDVAPDIDLVNVSTGVRTRLRDLRGKVVCLELWETGCGPCQPAMAKLNQLAAEKRDAWRGRVAIVPLSIDEQLEDVARHVKQRAWDQLDHYWSGAEGSKGWNAPVIHAFGLEGVPHLLIINRDGRIVWRGHPADPSQDLAARIEELVKR
jgi:thiol-disulfide isomerase/thioredoxin